MDTSLEVRWFCQGTIPDSVQCWFRAIAPQAVQEIPRDDIYLLTSSADLGIKYRQGRFEVKKRLVTPDTIVPSTLPGTLECWVKWSVPILPEDPTMPALDEPDHWLPVRKSRSILRYQYVPGIPLIPLPAGQIPIQGGALELTEVLIDAHPWWTFGIETHGPLNAQSTCFKLLANKVLVSAGSPTLTAISSYSYPQWMLNVHQPG